ncbi:MAG TPA: alanine--glyoxylate aminotransferase family protein [Aigarchaeota archaeon]|nr:alanine--glyoxylate aminotransferase family protein [Aigarchaeota archaeon]
MDRILMIPGPTDVDQRVIDAMRRQMIDHRSGDFRVMMRELEERSRRIFQTENDVYLLTCSGTGGVEFAVANLVDKDDRVLVPVFGVFGERLAEACEFYTRNVVRVEIPLGRAADPEVLKKALDENKDVNVVAFPYNDTSTGTICHDLEGIMRICRERGVYTIVDAVSILGGRDIPVDRLGIDVCITGSQKCLAAPPGVALVSFSERAYEKARRKEKRPHYLDVTKYRHFLRDRAETPFTPVITIFFALNESLRIILEEVGFGKWVRRHEAGAEALYKGLERLGVSFMTEPRYRSPTVIALNPQQGIDAEEIRRVMRERFSIMIAGGLAKFRGKMFRIANIGNISQQRILLTIEALGKTLNILGVKADVEEAVNSCKEVFAGRWPG